ncbi:MULTISPECIES: DUF421 domain-containing protein [unclassified Paenibacillus]|uniref:DUF421 domain-containing protein n=1 Tax=unclassified Paenibacillus TaxID=185978 RepID=UPI001AE686A4|nr:MULTISPECIES: DUF421 domain-containing protein [unclassified Paenibacillus]MBP1153754.1 uncharacterized membrane protein YcaP (DUF421 family) [Paenibacillus sp. PvP091]MBP1170861.1 uncharacterized membrane protein YcaP (DUF421 family) [Paenibacillus sp. PvR098]MBP2441889.1 uncharacterized membrane protein YcaP (DUF421 family) [Paenibacillus sp. PvP052]
MPDWLEVGLRTLFAVVILFLMTRLLGKRQISQLSFFEYITGITIGSLAAYISLDMEATWYLGLVSLFVWVMVSLGIEFLQMKSKRLRDFIDSKATVLIKDGKVLEDNIKKERLSTDELLQQLRKKNVFKTADVEFAVIEPSGEINVLVKKEHQPLTPSHLGITVGPEQEPQTVIMDGKMMDEPLATMGLSREWLYTELGKVGVTIENVFLGQVDSYGQLYVDLYDDQLKVPAPQQKASLLAQLKKCEADMEMFGLSTDNEAVKQMYMQCSNQLEHIIADVKPLLIR